MGLRKEAKAGNRVAFLQQWAPHAMQVSLGLTLGLIHPQRDDARQVTSQQGRPFSLLVLICFPGWSHVHPFSSHLGVQSLKMLWLHFTSHFRLVDRTSYLMSPWICWSDLKLTMFQSELMIFLTELSALCGPLLWKWYHSLSSHTGEVLAHGSWQCLLAPISNLPQDPMNFTL